MEKKLSTVTQTAIGPFDESLVWHRLLRKGAACRGGRKEKSQNTRMKKGGEMERPHLFSQNAVEAGIKKKTKNPAVSYGYVKGR